MMMQAMEQQRGRAVRYAADFWIMARGTPESTEGTTLYTAPIVLGPAQGMRLSALDTQRLGFWAGIYSRHLVRAMQAFIMPGATVYDVGAHVGYLSLTLSRLVGLTGTVVSFEPDPRNLIALRASVRRNNLRNIRVEPVAVSDKLGTVEFLTFDYSFVNHLANVGETPSDARHIEVPVVSLDDCVASGIPTPSFINIDVEGAEAEVLHGAAVLLATHRPVIAVEARRESGPTVHTIMRGQGYKRSVLGTERGITDLLYTPQSVTAPKACD